MNIHNGEMR